ncbi:MAG: hypothetical protein R3F49_03750 [Planctomycetota bacterium]
MQRKTSTHPAPMASLAMGLAASIALSAAPARAQGQTPFAQGERWGHVSGPANPWLPDATTFAAGDELVVVASRGGAGGLAVYGAHDGASGVARGFDARYALAQGATAVAAGERADAVYALAQYPAPDAYTRRVELARHDPVAAARGGSFAPVWLRELDIRINGPSRLACDEAGDVVVAAAYDDRTGNVRVDRVDGVSGALLVRRDLPAPGLSRLALSGDGRRVAISAGLELWILDELGQTVHTRSLDSAAQALAFSFDGATLAIGGTGKLQVVRESVGGSYALLSNFNVASNELAAATSVSRDGGDVAIAWWNFSTGVDARMELWHLATMARTADFAQVGTPISRQNLPVVASITADGRRAAFGLWGDGGTPEVVLLEAGRALPLMAFDLPGSVRALDFDETGTRVVVAHKNVHNSQWGASGAVRLLDTGERSLELLDTPEAGGALQAVARHQGAGMAFFALGQPLAAGQSFPGVQGELLLQRGTMTVFPAALDASGRANLTLPLANHPALIGSRVHIQAAFRVPGALALSPERLDALIL